MALQACRECGQMVSTEASSCPACGVPSPTKSAVALADDAREDVVYQAHVHPIIYGWAALVTIAFLFTLIPGNPNELRLFFLALAVIVWVISYIVASSMEFTITERRVMTRTGIIRKNSQETLLEKVETVTVDQSLPGRMLNYGTVTVVGTGGSHDEFKRISRPLELRRALHDQIDRKKGGR